MKYYVYYSDDYADNGGMGFEEFNEKDEALSFIQSRFSHDPKLSDYRLIKGSELNLRAVETVTKIAADS